MTDSKTSHSEMKLKLAPVDCSEPSKSPRARWIMAAGRLPMHWFTYWAFAGEEHEALSLFKMKAFGHKQCPTSLVNRILPTSFHQPSLLLHDTTATVQHRQTTFGTLRYSLCNAILLRQRLLSLCRLSLPILWLSWQRRIGCWSGLAAAKQVKAVKLPNSVSCSKDISSNQLCCVFPRYQQSSTCSQNVSILD